MILFEEVGVRCVNICMSEISEYTCFSFLPHKSAVFYMSYIVLDQEKILCHLCVTMKKDRKYPSIKGREFNYK